MTAPSTPANIVGIILAAGRSRRMGAFKPMLPFGTTTVVRACVDYLRDGGVPNVVVVVGHRKKELMDHLKDTGVVFAENVDPDAAMSTSVACGVNAVPPGEGAFVITPVDSPAVPANVVGRLLKAWRQGAPLVKPSWQGRGGHPVVTDMSFREQLLNLDPGRGLKALFEDHLDHVKHVVVETNYIARDLDTWDDYAALHLEVFGVPPPPRSAN